MFNNYENVKLRNGDVELIKTIQINDTLTHSYFDNNNLYMEVKKQQGLKGLEETFVLHFKKNGQLDKYSVYIDDKLKFYKFYEDQPSYGGNPLLYYDLDCEYYDTVMSKTYFKIDYQIAYPPHCIPHLMYGIYVENDKLRDLEKEPVYEIDIKNGRTFIHDKFDLTGDYKKTIYWSIRDTLIDHYYNGKNILNFHVK
ncbi:hypothetical protein [Carboxylicivirga caseinilyticus]|uniref:hypothetical protein n=1 Tax=Carboxylicivirga caseinilyticus TaxID=3417572 RepID=UPI003D356B0A|nr:hypothetical protein [Marinilabiliaceae bacterium A049]